MGDAGARSAHSRLLQREAATVGYAAIVLEAGVYLAHAHRPGRLAGRRLAALDAAVAAASDEASLHAAAVERARAACLAHWTAMREARHLL